MKKLLIIYAVVGMLLTASADVKGTVTKLLLHFDGEDGATETTDSSPSGHAISFAGDAQLDTALLLDGSGDYLSIPDSDDWDIFGSSTDDWTVDFWTKHNVSGNTEIYVSQKEDNDNRWLVYKGPTDRLSLVVKSGGDTLFSIIGATSLSTGQWYYVALCKVGDKYGLYLDGDQDAYVEDSDTDTYSAALAIGAYDFVAGNQFFVDGRMDELRITHSNFLNASPNADPSDTITVPTGHTPEPATIALLGLGGLALLRRKRRA